MTKLDKALERYTNNAEYERTHENLQGCLEFRQLVEWLKELKKLREQTRWIPASERLPEEETDVLICNENGDIELSRGSYSTEVENDFIWYTSGWRFGKIIAWMPLPEPYKAESKERGE